jgi:hypothetical protein
MQALRFAMGFSELVGEELRVPSLIENLANLSFRSLAGTFACSRM